MRYLLLCLLIILVGCQDKYGINDYVQLKRNPDIKGFVSSCQAGELVNVDFNIKGLKLQGFCVPESELELVPLELPASSIPDPSIKFFKIPKNDPLYDLLNPPLPRNNGIPGLPLIPEDKQA